MSVFDSLGGLFGAGGVGDLAAGLGGVSDAAGGGFFGDLGGLIGDVSGLVQNVGQVTSQVQGVLNAGAGAVAPTIQLTPNFGVSVGSGGLDDMAQTFVEVDEEAGPIIDQRTLLIVAGVGLALLLIAR